MKIHEYQAKEILKQYGVSVPRGIPAYTPQEALEAAQQLGTQAWVVKAQIHAGAREMVGGIKVASSAEEVQQFAEQLLGSHLKTEQTQEKGQKVRRLLIEEFVSTEQELYIAFGIDQERQQILLLTCEQGGSAIDELLKKKSALVLHHWINPSDGLTFQQAHQVAMSFNLPPAQTSEVASTLQKLYQIFCEKDALMLEINPLAITTDEQLLALDAKLRIDDKALFRQTALFALRDLDEKDPKEVEANYYGLDYQKIGGSIACIANGKGLAFATADSIRHHGGEVSGIMNVSGDNMQEKISAAFQIIRQEAQVKAIVANIFGDLFGCDVIAQSIIAAYKEAALQTPMIIQLRGLHEDAGRAILTNALLPIVNAEHLEEASQQAVSLSKKTST